MNLENELLLKELDELIPETEESCTLRGAFGLTFFPEVFRKEYEGTFAVDDGKVEHTKIKIVDIPPITFSNEGIVTKGNEGIATKGYVDSQISVASATMVKEITARITKQLEIASYGPVFAIPPHSHAAYSNLGIDLGSEHMHTNYKSPMRAWDKWACEFKMQQAKLRCSPPPIILPKSQLEDLEYFNGKASTGALIPPRVLSDSPDSKKKDLLKSQTNLNELQINIVIKPSGPCEFTYVSINLALPDDTIDDNFEHAMGVVK